MILAWGRLDPVDREQFATWREEFYARCLEVLAPSRYFLARSEEIYARSEENEALQEEQVAGSEQLIAPGQKVLVQGELRVAWSLIGGVWRLRRAGGPFDGLLADRKKVRIFQGVFPYLKHCR